MKYQNDTAWKTDNDYIKNEQVKEDRKECKEKDEHRIDLKKIDRKIGLIRRDESRTRRCRRL